MSDLRPLLAIGLLLLALALVPVATGGWTAVPAPWWLGLAAGAMLVWALRRGGAPNALRDLPVAALLGLAAASAHLAPGMLLGHDVSDHAWGAWAYLQAWHAGDWLPIWLHHLGLGQPMPLFYGPLPFWAMAPFALVTGDVSRMLSGSFALASVVASLTAWGAVAHWTRDRRGALVAAAAMAFAPYRLFDANYRIALGETWAVGLLPLGIFAFERLLAGPSRRRFALAVLSVSLITLAHPLSLVLLAIALGALTIIRYAFDPGAIRVRSSLLALRRCALAGLTGLALAGFFVVPLVAELRFLELRNSVDETAEQEFSSHALAPIELVTRRLWDRLDISRKEVQPAGAASPEQPYYFGLALLGALLFATISRQPAAPRDGPRNALGVLGCFSLLLALGGVASFASFVPGVPLLQFPWRFLGLASAAAALAAGLMVASARETTRRLSSAAVISTFALALLVDGFPFSGAAGRLERWRGLVLANKFAPGRVVGVELPRPWPLRVYGPIFPPTSCCTDVGLASSVYREYVTPEVGELMGRLRQSGVGLWGRIGRRVPWMTRLEAEPYARLDVPGTEKPLPLEFERGGGTISVEMPDGRGGRVVIGEQYFPGWKVDLDGQWREVVPTRQGLLAASAPRGQRRVRFRFDRWRWDRAFGWISTLLAGGLLLVGRPRRTPPRTGGID